MGAIGARTGLSARAGATAGAIGATGVAGTGAAFATGWVAGGSGIPAAAKIAGRLPLVPLDGALTGAACLVASGGTAGDVEAETG